MLVWINGAFGVGKSTTADKVVARRPEFRLFNPELVGYMLMSNLTRFDVDDFQDLSAWRALVPVVARHLTDTTGEPLVVVQTVLSREYWADLRSGLAAQGFSVLHVLLDADGDTLCKRIHADEQERNAEQWRLDHIGAYLAARPWLVDDADLVIDTSKNDTETVADEIVQLLPRP
jgi:broad-specificity NMP kinase